MILEPILSTLSVLFLCLVPTSEDGDSPSPSEFGSSVRCEGHYPRHLQGISADDQGNLYWSFTVELVKTDPDGKVLRSVAVASHHGDLCLVDGRLYVAVNLGAFNEPPGSADSWVYVYDADTLEELARHRIPEVVHGAGGVAYHDGTFLVVGGLPPGTNENYLYEYDESFAFHRRHVLPSGYTLMGIQTAAFADGAWWFGCYGAPGLVEGRRELPAHRALGPRRLAWDRGHRGRETAGGRGARDQSGHSGVVHPYKVDGANGLRRIKSESR